MDTQESFEEILRESRKHGREAHFDFSYPDTGEDKICFFVIGLMDTRATDDIRISFDKDRNGWLIERRLPYRITGPKDVLSESVVKEGWIEAALLPSWPFED